MAGHDDPPRLVLCEDDPILRGWLMRLAADAGVEVVATTDRWGIALERVVDRRADALILDLATVGRVGARFVSAVRAVAPDCRIVVLSPFRQVDLTVMEAGADVVADATDLRPFVAALRDLARGPALPDVAVELPTLLDER